MVVGPQHAQTRRSPDSRRIAVIGAGAAGLCAARHLSAAGLRFVVFEQTWSVGGTWVYNERVGLDQFGLPVHSSMYKNLRINIPKCIMSYPDYPFPEGGRSYAAHSEVLDHLNNYAQHFDLYKYVQFHTHVKRVSPQGSRWNVLVEELKAGNVLEHTFDCVLVCNGHYSKPYTPVLTGAAKYTGLSMHSHDYREPSRFVGKDVVVLGASASGMDIAVEVSTVANKVYLCHNLGRLKTKLPNNVHECVGIKEALEDGFRLLDGTTISADIIVYCTGYEYDFSFLAPECGIRVQNNRVTPLYKHMIHRDNPSLTLIGIPYTVIPFLVFHYQVRYFVSVWTGRVALPSREQMSLEEEEDYKKHLALFPAKHAHKKQELQWDYLRDLAESGAFEDDMPPVVRDLYNNSEDDRTNSVLSYRNVEFKLKSTETYERLPPSKQTT